MNHTRISRRFQEFSGTLRAKPYQRQRSALEQQFSDFLVSLSPPKCISSCTSDDVIKFLISKDSSGRTVVHSQLFPKVSCNCPTCLAAGTVDFLLEKFRDTSKNIGRSRDSNPVLHPRVKEYLEFVREEQASKDVVPSQAVPMFFIKFSTLINFLRHSIKCSVDKNRSKLESDNLVPRVLSRGCVSNCTIQAPFNKNELYHFNIGQ